MSQWIDDQLTSVQMKSDQVNSDYIWIWFFLKVQEVGSTSGPEEYRSEPT